LRSILKLVSFADMSVHVTLTAVADVAVALTPEGAVGGVGVVADGSLEYDESRPLVLLVARTR
jgi:hypothetical protein